MTTHVTDSSTRRAAPATKKWVYDFSEGSRDMRELLGGKGAGVAEMTRLLGPDLVPAGFTITTEACVAYMRRDRSFPKDLAEQVDASLAELEERTGKALGDAGDPLLVSVRSGARESMPGMMDTVLNLGLNDESAAGLAARTGDERFAWDCYRRLVQMFGNVVCGVAGERFEDEIARSSESTAWQLDTELDAERAARSDRDLQVVLRVPERPSRPARPGDPRGIRLVDGRHGRSSTAGSIACPTTGEPPSTCSRWCTATRASRRAQGWPSAATRSPARPQPSGDFLPNAQGEDVVSGVRTPRDLSELRDWLPPVAAQLEEILRKLEAHYKDMQDTEFTVEEGRLFMLQTRSAKRPAQAAVRFAVDAFEERLLTKAEAIGRSTPGALDALLHPSFDTSARYTVIARGVAASPGAAKGKIVFTAPEAVEEAANGCAVILVRPFTEADDVAGFHAAVGILTSEGGKASHAALVARGMGRPAVTGAGDLDVDLKLGEARVGELVLHKGDFIAIDGTTGAITTDDVPLVEAHVDARFETILRWSDELRQIGVRANADTPEDATRAHRFGAEGIGLCRTEHMFMAADRQPKMRAMIMAGDEAGRRAALDELLPLQQSDFEGLFEAMKGWPVTIRLLDPPLHEFLPDRYELHEQIVRARIDRSAALSQLESQFDRVRSLEETNPDAGDPGRAAGRDPPRDLRDAGAGDRARRLRREGAKRPGSQARDHDPAGGVRARARARQGPGDIGCRGGGPGLWRRLRRRDDDRAAESLPDRRSDRAPRRLLLLWHKRSDPGGHGLLPRRHRKGNHPALRRGEDRRQLALRDPRRVGDR